jgi:hypothetical protein
MGTRVGERLSVFKTLTGQNKASIADKRWPVHWPRIEWKCGRLAAGGCGTWRFRS